MSLTLSDDIAWRDLRFLVKSVRVVKIYYVWTGRNAWWSTWATRYSPGCFHRSIESAKTFCEDRRVQGTVFYISELPALCFTAGTRAIIATEINSEAFFAQYRFKLLRIITTALPFSGMTLDQAKHLFSVEGILWPEEYPRKNSAFVCFYNGDNSFSDLQKDDNISHYISSSNGPGYYLGWSQKDFTKDRTSIHRLADFLARRLAKL